MTNRLPKWHPGKQLQRHSTQNRRVGDEVRGFSSLATAGLTSFGMIHENLPYDEFWSDVENMSMH
jgi:hypothetical protein